MSDDERERRLAAVRACTRVLSGVRPETMRERLAAIAGRSELDGWPDRYGDGPVAALEERVRELLGTASATFFPTGTMAQQVALRYWTHDGEPVVAMHPLGHLEVHERHAYARLGGLAAVWPTTAPRQPTAAEVAGLGEPFSVLLLELPLREAGFVLPTWDELVAVVGAARERGAWVHVDGARLWESTSHLGQPLPEAAALADSVYVSFYKSLGGLSGAVLAGPAELGGYAKAWRHRYGGQVFEQWPAALSALHGLAAHLPRLPELVAHAAVVAKALAQVPGARVFPEPPHTHQFRLWLPHSAGALNAAALEMAEQERVLFVDRWSETDVPGVAMAEVTVAEPALEWTAAETVDVAERFLARVTAAPQGPTGAAPDAT
ncbi:threonine aldolase family protein [Rhizomonospora bruguierae]|uniref:threonine aldolase family protein n=1 Tax=Rhizomonospora bruguierae TaxID=1581705 RepID=UPI001BCA8115|nr:beta-eliminating lyase-related protein [Micromonospora sp. NBRC 107566]